MVGRRVSRAAVMEALGKLGLSEAELARTRTVVMLPSCVSVELFRLNAFGSVLVSDQGEPLVEGVMITIDEARRPPLRVGPAKTGPHLNAAGRTGESA